MNSIEENTLPKEWRLDELKNYLSIQNGYAFNSKKFTDTSDGIPLIRIRNLKESTLTTFYTGDYDDKFIVRKGDFLIGMDGEFRCYEWRNEDALLNQRVCRIVDVNEQLDSRFLFYGINKYLKDIEDVTSFVTVKHISSKQIKEINFPLPPLEEQKRIVSKIDALFTEIDKAISLTEESLKQVENLLPSVLNGIFRKGKAEGWEEKKLGEVCDVVGGGTPKTKIPEYWDGEIVWLSPTDLPPIGEISSVSDSRKKITDAGLNKSSAKLLPKGSVIYSTRASIGKIAIAEIPLSTNQGFTNFICREGLSNHYLCYCLKHFNKMIEKLSNSTTFKEVSKSAMKEFEIPVPSIDKQNLIVNAANDVLLKSKQTQSKLESQLIWLKQLKSSVLNKAFKGEL